MKNKRIISLILALIMLLAVPVGVFADPEAETNSETTEEESTLGKAADKKDQQDKVVVNNEGKDITDSETGNSEEKLDNPGAVSDVENVDDRDNDITVSFDLNDRKSPEGKDKNFDAQTVKTNAKVTKPSDPIKEGYDFTSWKYGDTTFDFSKTLKEQNITENITLVAQWEKKEVEEPEIVSVTFDLNEGIAKDGETSQYNVQNINKGEMASKPDATPIREGYNFGGWTIVKNGSVVFDFTTKVEDNITLYAKWNKVEPIKHSLTIHKRYDSNGYFYGTVKDENGNRVPYATVSLYNYDSSSYVRSVTTDSDGDFKIYVGYYYDDYRYYDGHYYDGHKVHHDSFNDRYYYFDNNGDKTWLSKNWNYYDGYYYDRDYRYGRYYYGYLRATKDGYSYGDYKLNDYYWYDGRYYDRNYSVTPTIKEANAGSKIVKGTAGDYATVEVYDDNGIKLGKTTANRNGDFTVYLDRDLKYGERIKVEAKDGSRYTSSRYYTVAYKDNIPTTTDTIARPAYIAGYPDGSFKPEKTVSRAEAVRMFVKLVNNGSELASNPNTAFSDANNGWYSDEINFAVDKGFIKGYSDGTFKPNNEITRAEFAQIISSFVQKGYPGSTGFKDIKGHWASDAISALYGNKNIKGYPDGTFKPNQKLTRAEAVTILNSVFGRNTKVNSLYNINSQGLRTFNDVGTGHWAYYEILDASNAHITNKIDAKDGIEIWK